METFRTPEQRFDAWIDFPFDARYVEWQGLRMHYVDEGPSDGPVMLMCHGMPTSSYLYRRMIPALVAAGYRCIAADCIGFGKSDKVLDDAWYSIEKHSESITYLIQNLDIERITLICQDWGGPIGLRQAVDMPARFDRLTIMNTWLHHPEYQYTEALRNWNAGWHSGGQFDETQACGLVNNVYDSQDQMLDAVHTIAAEIAGKSPLAVNSTKHLLNYGREHSVSDTLNYQQVWMGAVSQGGEMGKYFAAKPEGKVPEYDDLPPLE